MSASGSPPAKVFLSIMPTLKMSSLRKALSRKPHAILSLRLFTLATFGLALSLGGVALTACQKAGRKHITYGVIDTVNVVPLRSLADLSYEEIEAQYLGKVVTFSRMTPNGVRAKNEDCDNVCMMSFLPDSIGRGVQTPYWGGKKWELVDISVYFNWGDEIVEWLKHTEPANSPWQLENPLHVDFSICDTVTACVADEAKPACPFQDHFLIAGKVIGFEISGTKHTDIYVKIRPTGLRL